MTIDGYRATATIACGQDQTALRTPTLRERNDGTLVSPSDKRTPILRHAERTKDSQGAGHLPASACPLSLRVVHRPKRKLRTIVFGFSML
jgi:hypothetical protein